MLERKKFWRMGLALLAAVFLTGCGAVGETESRQETVNPLTDPAGRTVLTVATFYASDKELTERVNVFNQTNTEYFVEIMGYEWDGPEGHPADSFATWLTVQILSGEGPDMVEYGGIYSPAVASGKLMEDLYPYMESDEDIHMEDYYENILQAFEQNGGLYVLPAGFKIDTMCGKREELGEERGVTEAWEIGEMIEAYENSKSAEQLLINHSKSLIFWELCSGCMGNYVNWETGECSFEAPEFIELLEFSDTFSDQLLIAEDFSYFASLQSGQTFLQPVLLTGPKQIAIMRVTFGDVEMCWPGYPVADGEKELGGGVADICGPALSICANSRNKEGAWEFIKSFLTPEVQSEVAGIPLLRAACEERIEEALTVEYETVDGVQREKVKFEIVAEGEDSIPMTCITEEDAEIFRSIVEGTRRSTGVDRGLADIIVEEAGAYFEKDKDAAAVAAVIRNRASVYVQERMK